MLSYWQEVMHLNIYERIDLLLEKHNISKLQLCKKAGINYNAFLACYNRKSDKLPFDTLTAIASVFKVPIDYLVSGNRNGGTTLIDVLDVELFSEFQKLNDEGKVKVTRYAKDMQGLYSKSAIIKYLSVHENEGSNVRMLPLHEYPASAGRGTYVGESEHELTPVPEGVPFSAHFGVRISGDSMEPKIPDGSIVWVRQQPDVDEGQICVLTINEDGYCKVKGKKSFASINKKYKDIKPASDDVVTIAGLVVYIQPPEEQ